MSVLIVAGFKSAWCEFAEQRLSEMGVSKIQSDSSMGIQPNELLDKIERRQNEIAERFPSENSPTLGRAWDLAAAAIFIANADFQHWSWADPRHAHLLRFWAGFDPDCVFILLYGSHPTSLGGSTSEQMIKQTTPESDAEKWHDYHSKLLHFYYSCPERCLLVHVDHFDGVCKELIGSISKRFSVPVRRLNTDKHRESSSIAKLLLEAQLEENSEYSDTFVELENAADLQRPSGEEEKISLIRRAEKELEEFQVTALRLDKIEFENLNLKAQIKRHEQVETEQRLKIERQTLEQSSILDQVFQLKEENESLRRSVRSLNGEIVERQNQLNAKDAKISEAARQLDEQQQDESRLLKLQLAQSREELELYFRKYQDTKRRLEEATNVDGDASVTFERYDGYESIEPEGTKIDLRNYFEGRGWHNSEPQGRWAGAENVSTIVLPNLDHSDYTLKLRIVDTMTNDHLHQIKLAFNGRALDTKLRLMSDSSGRLAPFRRFRARMNKSGKPVPAEILAKIPTEAMSRDGQSNVLTIRSADPVSPADHGHADSRKLSVCFENVIIQG